MKILIPILFFVILLSPLFSANAVGFLDDGSGGSSNDTNSVSNQVNTIIGNGKSIADNGTVAPPITGDKRQAIINKFNITMNGFDDPHLEAAWEFFWRVSNTKFNSLISGSIINASINNISSQVGCPSGISVEIFPYLPKEFFQYLLSHELGHVVANCQRPSARQDEIAIAAQDEGAVSYYGGNAPACTGSDNYSENYADVVAYYLNPQAGFATYRCDPQRSPQNPFYGSSVLKPRQKAIAEQVLGAL